MPMIWRTLSVIQTVVDFHAVDLGLPELAQTYHLRSHGSYYFLFKVKPNRPHLVLRTKQNDPNWKSRFFFVDRNSLPNSSQIPSSWLLKVDFAALVPPDLDTEEKLRAFVEIPEDERTFKHSGPSESAGSLESRTSMSASYFSLLDIDNDSPEDKVEKSTPSAAKSRMPNLRSKSSKKRKADDVFDPANLDSEFAKTIEHLSKCYNEKASAFNDMCKLSLVTKNAHEKDAAELAKVKKEVKDLKAYILKITAEADAKTEEITQELTARIKRDAAIVIFEARIKMAAEASEKGFDTSLWPVSTWEAKLAKAKNESLEATDSSASRIPKAMQNSPADLQDQRTSKMDQLASVTEVLEGLAAAEDNTLGKEGK